jgi:predicted nucleic-acid-binding protein
MIGLDTNVLVRYFVNDNELQHKMARELVDQNNIYLTNIVLVESYWVLKRLMKLDRTQLLSCFYCLLQMSNVEFENCTAFAGALHQFKNRQSDFADAYINRLHQLQGVVTASFDSKAIDRLGFVYPQDLL